MVEFLSADGSVIASSSYPCGPIHFTETFLKTTPLIAGLQSGTQVLNIKTIEHVEGLQPTACLKVVLEQRAELFQNGAGIPQIYAASLELEYELPRLKRFFNISLGCLLPVWYWNLAGSFHRFHLLLCN
ncbi:hypothetical protein D8674_038847 [Pyrus ussuriensis x Pyrus communis]|uniref:Uncharacterized protein n=1 Tax=Pyrus ussuriensis x Pyrus communis TaxID=2448454 RepID=A0A5N5H6H9_9ROSA|nr:hypothetical protein D8674_038847 [Pyrus ussuriensis x Pyrus communis]